MGIIDSFIIQHPFNKYNNINDSIMIYDSKIPNNNKIIYNIIEYLNAYNKKIYFKIDPFRASRYYNKEIYKNENFVYESLSFRENNYLVLDINNKNTLDIIESNSIIMKSQFPDVKYYFELSSYKKNKDHLYRLFKKHFGDTSLIIDVYSNKNSDINAISFFENYTNLVIKNDLKFIKNITNKLQIINNDIINQDIYNTILTFIFLNNRNTIIMKYNNFIQISKLIYDFINYAGNSKIIINDNILLGYNNRFVYAFSLNEEISIMRFNNIKLNSGLYKAKYNSAVLNITKDQLSIFVLPYSYNFWILN